MNRANLFYVVLLALTVCRLSESRGECPHGQRMDHLVRIPRGSIPMNELWDMGADDMGLVGDDLLLRVSPPMLDEIADRGVPVEIIHEDLDEAYAVFREQRAVRYNEPFFQYHNHASAVAVMERIADENPQLAALEIIGQSIEGRPIYVLRLSSNAEVIDDEKPAILVDGCHHAREWISVEVPLYLADYLVDNYRKNGDVTRLLNYAEVWIAPILNPDGYVYSETTDRWWRKNRRNNGDGTFGVDCNRNYAIGWGDDLGSSGFPYSEVYRGTAPFSEPETRAVRDLFEGAFGRTFQASLSYHNFSQLVMYPNGFTHTPVNNRGFYDALAAEMTKRINDSHADPQHDYYYGPISEVLYLASGSSTDWVHHAMGAIAFVIELRPAGPPFFELAPEEILPTCRENLPAFLYLAEQTLIPSLRILDADQDGYLDADDYCPHSPTVVIDDLGCGDTEQDVDLDGVPNRMDACRDSLPGQRVTADGCRVAALFGVDVVANVSSISVSVSPPDIDAFGPGNTGVEGFRREYAERTTIELSAPLLSDGNRFVNWIIDGVPLPVGEHTIVLDQETDVRAEAVYIFPTGVEIVGQRRLPDVRPDGLGFTAQYTARLVYNDGSTFPVEAVSRWANENAAVGSIAANGLFLAYAVDAATGERSTALTAFVRFAAREFASPPFSVSVFDRETVAPRCWRLQIMGVDTIEARSRARFTAQSWWDGEFEPRHQPTSELAWSIRTADGSAPSVLAQISSSGELNASATTQDVTILVRAALINDDNSACLAEKPVTITARLTDATAGQGLNDGVRAASCGSMGVISFFGLFVGLLTLRGRRE